MSDKVKSQHIGRKALLRPAIIDVSGKSQSREPEAAVCDGTTAAYPGMARDRGHR